MTEETAKKEGYQKVARRYGLTEYSDDQPRDESGRWTGGGGGGDSSPSGGAVGTIKAALSSGQGEKALKSLGEKHGARTDAASLKAGDTLLYVREKTGSRVQPHSFLGKVTEVTHDIRSGVASELRHSYTIQYEPIAGATEGILTSYPDWDYGENFYVIGRE